jgi:hypothetical protein
MNGKTVFLSFAPEEKRAELKSILERAGLKVVTGGDSDSDPASENARMLLDTADCSLHILDPHVNHESSISIAKSQFNLAKKEAESRPGFKIFIWQTGNIPEQVSKSKQAEFINEIRNSVGSNMYFTDVSSMIQLVDDVRSLLESKQKVQYNLKETDVFLVFNQLDESEAAEIVDMLSDIIPVERLCIVQDSDEDYSELCAQQIGSSKIAVVYFKFSSDWALPFTQQIWKKIGGASSRTPILLIGDEVPDINKNIKINAPKVICLVVAGELIPLEIKVQYDKVIGIS